MFSPSSQLARQPVPVRIGLSGENLPGFEQASARQMLPRGVTFVGPPCLCHPPTTEPEEALEHLGRVRGHSPHERDQDSLPPVRNAPEEAEA